MAKNETSTVEKTHETLNFIEEIIEKDLKNGKNEGRVHTRFPPEPNGYLHLGHAKSICLNFGLAQKYKGLCNLRFDDTNPVTEDTEYVEAIEKDVKWLGFDWGTRKYFASDFFDQLYQYAIDLVRSGHAYVCDLTPDQISEMRGKPTESGKESPYRTRSVAENLDLLERMKNGEFADGSRVLRAKIDMASPNMHLRDPIIYRIRKAKHHRTADKWNIYPMYDFAHGLCDSLEGITHSVCTLEFEVHRPLYDWFLDSLQTFHPQQIEFARLNINYTVLSKRKLLQLVEEKYVKAWDDPRMPTISGIRRRGYSPESIHNFAEKIGIAKRDNIIDFSLLEFCVREDLNKRSQRGMGVLEPLKLVITNYPEGQVEYLEADNNPEKPESGKRQMPFGREIFIEQEDFMENPPADFYRLALDREVRLKYAYIIKCNEVLKNEKGEIVEVRCTYEPESKSGQDKTGKKVKSALHWVYAPQAVSAEIRIYDRLFSVEDPEGDKNKDFKEFLNPNSLRILQNAKLEPFLKEAKLGQYFQFERKGYFVLDPDSQNENLVFNQSVTLKDAYAKGKSGK